jgi:hypothetical protein
MAGRDAREHRLEILGTILLTVAALATAWTTFQAGRWRGEQAAATRKTEAARIESSEAHTRAGQLTQIDIAMFIQWANGNLGRDRKQATFYRRRFRKEFRPAFDAWIATRPFTNPAAPTSPFVMPQYRLAATERATELAALATVRSAESADANQNANDYLLALVLFASSLFFAGIATKVRTLGQQEALLGVGWLIFVATLVWIATRPVTFSF